MKRLIDLHSDLGENGRKQREVRDGAAGRNLNNMEKAYLDDLVTEADRIQSEIYAARSDPGNTLAAQAFLPGGRINPLFLGGAPGVGAGRDPKLGPQAPTNRSGQFAMSADYVSAFLTHLRSGAKMPSLEEGFEPMFGGYAVPDLPHMEAALSVGTNSAGGYAVSTPTDDQIVPLAVPDLGVRSLARVIPTVGPLLVPTQGTFGTAGIKAESGGSTNTFSESDPTLGEFTLSAFMIGLTHTVSWELLQDAAMFQTFAVQDLLNAVDISEDGFFVSGSGTAQPQGVVGNVGTGTGSSYAVESTGAYLLDATEDVVGTLKSSYFPGAAWLMNRTTATAIKKAQRQANLFAPVWTREGGRDYLHGYPVAYSGTMPSLPTTTNAGVTPMLFGSFKDGYVIGDRGGSGTFVKILDQPLATAGQTILLAYKRVDGRVRRSEAIQGISISHS